MSRQLAQVYHHHLTTIDVGHIQATFIMYLNAARVLTLEEQQSRILQDYNEGLDMVSPEEVEHWNISRYQPTLCVPMYPTFRVAIGIRSISPCMSNLCPVDAKTSLAWNQCVPFAVRWFGGGGSSMLCSTATPLSTTTQLSKTSLRWHQSYTHPPSAGSA